MTHVKVGNFRSNFTFFVDIVKNCTLYHSPIANRIIACINTILTVILQFLPKVV